MQNQKSDIKKKGQKVTSSKGFLVTISQINIKKDRESLDKILNQIKDREDQLSQTVTALSASLEEHKDKGVHLHFAIAFNKRRTLDLNYWNFLFNKQANIQKITWNQKSSRSRAFAYSIKTQDVFYQDEGAKEIMSFVVRTYTGTQLDDYVVKLIEEGASLIALQTHTLPEVRTFVVKHHAMVSKAIISQKTVAYELEQEKKTGVIASIQDDFDTSQKEIFTWFNNIAKYGSKWPFRECCLMIIGKPKGGKSTLLRKLSEFVRSYSFPVANWFTGYRNDFYDVIIWEEPSFKHHEPDFLKRLLEGVELDLPMKGSLTTKSDRPLLCLCSNHSIKELFIEAYLNAAQKRHCNTSLNMLCSCKNMDECPIATKHVDFEAISTRVKEVYVKNPLFPLIDHLKTI